MPSPATSTRFTTSPWCSNAGLTPFLGTLFWIPIPKVVPNKLWAQSMLLLLPILTNFSSFLVEQSDRLKSQWRNLSVRLQQKWAKTASEEHIQWVKLFQHSNEHFIEVIFWHGWNCFASFSIFSIRWLPAGKTKFWMDNSPHMCWKWMMHMAINEFWSTIMMKMITGEVNPCHPSTVYILFLQHICMKNKGQIHNIMHINKSKSAAVLKCFFYSTFEQVDVSFNANGRWCMKFPCLSNSLRVSHHKTLRWHGCITSHTRQTEGWSALLPLTTSKKSPNVITWLREGIVINIDNWWFLFLLTCEDIKMKKKNHVT